MNIWVMGPGPSLLKYKKQINRLNGRNILAFQNVFPAVFNYFDVKPTHWTWGDVQSSKHGMKYLADNPNFDIKVLLSDPFCSECLHTGNITDFEKYIQGGKPIPNNGRCTEAADNLKEWKNYIGNYKKIKDDGRIEKIPSTTLSWLLKTLPINEVKNIMLPENRFNYDKVIFGTDLYENDWYMRENKLSFIALPILQYMGVKKVFVMGFDGLWGRFYDANWKTKKFMGEYKFLDRWTKWQKHTGMEIFSVTDCAINNHMKYISFEQAMEMDR